MKDIDWVALLTAVSACIVLGVEHGWRTGAAVFLLVTLIRGSI